MKIIDFQRGLSFQTDSKNSKFFNQLKKIFDFSGITFMDPCCDSGKLYLPMRYNSDDGVVESLGTNGTWTNLGVLHTQASNVAIMGSTTNLTAIAGSYADLAAARTSVNTLKSEVETRLDNIEAKIDAVINALTGASIMA